MQSALPQRENLEDTKQIQWNESHSQVKGEALYTFGLIGMLVCSLIVGVILAYEGCRYSYYPVPDYSTKDIIMQDSFWVHIAFAILISVAAWGLDRIFSIRLTFRTQEKICRIVLAVTAVLMFVFGTIYVSVNPYYPEGDQLNATAGAAYSLNDQYSMLTPGGYVGLYEQQKGFIFLYEILYALFEPFCYDVAKQFHVFFAVLTLVSGYGFIKNQFPKAFYRIIYCALMLFCMPLMLFLPYIYGDVPSICFSMICLWALSAYAKKMQARYIPIAALAAALALLCRMNTWIVLIAVGIGMVMLAIEKWNYRPLIVGLCVILVAAGAVKSVDAMYEYRSGYESGIGIPSILWIAMGLQETDGEAGVYNRYQQTVFEENGFNREVSAQIGKDYIAQRVQEFANDLPMTKAFFQDKIASQWSAPLFESLKATHAFDEEKPVAEWIANLYYGKLHDIIWRATNYYQSVVYIAMLFAVIGNLISVKKRKGNSVGWIPQIAIIGGFLFSLIWENQSRYCLPYYLLMLLYVPEGLMQIGSMIGGIYRKLPNGKHNDETDKQQLKKVS